VLLVTAPVVTDVTRPGAERAVSRSGLVGRLRSTVLAAVPESQAGHGIGG
jgi:hypothetical protein